MFKADRIRKRLLSEIPSVQAMLNDSVEEFFLDPSQESFSKVCNAMVTAVVYGLNSHVPVETADNTIEFLLVPNARDEYAYVMCNTPEELMKCPSKNSVVMPIKTLLLRVMNDSDIRIGGLIIDPYHALGNNYLQFTRTNVRYILNSANALIDSQDEITRDVLKKGLTNK